ncbi:MULTISPECIES: hypothetical protein [unclassified Streptomyces]|uniref:hypothetical protein n=1 Tax=unclassified Streptomyces TaxID=2593676 RepID=UPI0036426411
MTHSLTPDTRAAHLDTSRRIYMAQALAHLSRIGSTARVAPYVLAPPGEVRLAEVDTIRRYAIVAGWRMAPTSFADVSQPPPLRQRPGFTEACRYAVQGYVHGILAVARPALTTDDDTYAEILEYLHSHQVFLAYLSAEEPPPAV